MRLNSSFLILKRDDQNALLLNSPSQLIADAFEKNSIAKIGAPGGKKSNVHPVTRLLIGIPLPNLLFKWIQEKFPQIQQPYRGTKEEFKITSCDFLLFMLHEHRQINKNK